MIGGPAKLALMTLGHRTWLAPVRWVVIRKPGGGARPLGIPTLRDRVVQTAAKLVLEPIFRAWPAAGFAAARRAGRGGMPGAQKAARRKYRYAMWYSVW
jgi:RNA-directed DNA polymerase